MGFDKVLAPVAGVPALVRALRVLAAGGVPRAWVGVRAEAREAVRGALCGTGLQVTLVTGGDTRRETVARCLWELPAEVTHVVVHDAARPWCTPALVRRVLEAAEADGAAAAALPVDDTVHRASAEGLVAATVDRRGLWLAQTPQAFRRDVLARAHAAGLEATDDAGLVAAAGFAVRLVPGERTNVKLTRPADFPPAGPPFAVGQGYDVHRLVPGRPLVLGGTPIPFELGLEGHSDADALCHALADAVLGAAGLGDIGVHFPPGDPAYAGADSVRLLERCVAMAAARGWEVAQADCLVVAERPRLQPYLPAMGARLAAALGPGSRVNVKAGTAEGLGALGRGEGIAAHAVALCWRPAAGR
jgi:2-C-methyl-D-erythritol 4-phosphate cytidylyltransferase/2-C-methyl-D-erythritol 2,4-cyclodiphosphate synthase